MSRRTAPRAGGTALLACCVLAAAGMARPAEAQTCLGAPLRPAPSVGLLGGVGFASHDFDPSAEGTELGLEARGRLPMGFGVAVGVWRRYLEGDADPALFRAEGSWTLPRIPLVPTFGLSICPVAGISAARVSDEPGGNDFSNVTVPVGLAAGLPIQVGTALEAAPYAAFRWLFARVDGTVLLEEVEETDDSPALELGVGARAGRLLGIASFTFTGLEPSVGPSFYADRHFTLRVGVVF